MDGARLLSFLARKRYAVLATTRPDGRPQAAPVGYALVGTKFVMASLPDAQRVRNLKHEPHASLVIDEDESERHGVVIVDGTTRLLQPLEAGLEMRAPFRDDAGTFPDWIGVLIVLTPERPWIHIEALDAVVHGPCFPTKRAPHSPLRDIATTTVPMVCISMPKVYGRVRAT